ncbi:hypothetical protein FRB96_006831 [Tulasnella sp. 330]|nr:hypothetical protein FRB96_006831 [Tulasnella sp. 330]
MWTAPATCLRAFRLQHIIGALLFLASIHFFLFSGYVSSSYIDPTARTSSISHQAGSGGGRVLVTGGGGSIGKHLVRRLLSGAVTVTILDTTFDQKDLKAIYSEFPFARELLHVKTGDVRDTNVLSDVMTSDVDGVIHLAAVSRVQWCLEDKVECSNVNEKGTDAVLHALRDLNRLDRGRRWFVLASSRSVHDAQTFPTTKDEPEATPTTNAYSASKLAAEKILETHIQLHAQDASGGKLYANALRLPNVYGDVFDHVDRLVPSIFTQALSHQTIQVVGGQQNLDLLYIDDCVDAFILAIKGLDTRSRRWSLFAPRTYLGILDVTSGNVDVSVAYLVDRIVRLTRSKSPIRIIPSGGSSNTFVSNVPEYEGTQSSAPRLSELEDAIPIDDGLLYLTQAYLARIEQALTDQINSACSQPARPVTDTDLLKLDDCTVHITVDVQGQSHALDNKDLGAFMMNEDFPPKPMKTFATRRESDGKTIVRIFGNAKKGNKHKRWLGVTLPITNDGVFQGELPGVVPDDVKANNTLVDWELDVNAEQGTVRLVLAGTDYQLHPVTPRGTINLAMIVRLALPNVMGEANRFTLLIPNLAISAIDYMVEYQKYSTERPFLASPAKALCSRLQRARTKVRRDLSTLSVETFNEPRSHETSIPREWVDAYPAPCSNMCSLPTVCVDTGDCQCVLSSCPPILSRKSSAQFDASSDPSGVPLSPQAVGDTEVRTPLVDMVVRSSWRGVIRPQALTVIDAGVIPRVYVGPFTPKDQEWRQNDTVGKTVHRLRPLNCFSADSSMELALLHMNVSVEESDYTFIPMHQGRDGATERLPRTYEFNIVNTPHFDPQRVIIPFTHDWGLCMAFDWQVWGMRAKKSGGAGKFDPYIRLTTAWTTMGDLNSPCYRPAQDVVMPPRGCLSPQLFELFGNISDVRPARDRRVLVTFKGNTWGTGAVVRKKIMCSRINEGGITNLPGRRLITTHPIAAVWGNYGGRPSYLAMLNDTIFCVHAIGVAGWAPRLTDALYAGCIPVIIGHTTQFPFYDMIDWGKISVRIETSEIHRIEEILVTRYTIEDVERLQANIMLVRDAFVYPLDDVSPDTFVEKMFHKRGPLFFALYSTRMRMLTKWPTDAVYDRP